MRFLYCNIFCLCFLCGFKVLNFLMDVDDVDDEEFGFFRNYFLVKELYNIGKKLVYKFFDIDVVFEEVVFEVF